VRAFALSCVGSRGSISVDAYCCLGTNQPGPDPFQFFSDIEWAQAEGHRGPKEVYRGPKEVYRGPKEVYRGSKEVYRGSKEVYRGSKRSLCGHSISLATLILGIQFL